MTHLSCLNYTTANAYALSTRKIETSDFIQFLISSILACTKQQLKLAKKWTGVSWGPECQWSVTPWNLSVVEWNSGYFSLTDFNTIHEMNSVIPFFRDNKLSEVIKF